MPMCLAFDLLSGKLAYEQLVPGEYSPQLWFFLYIFFKLEARTAQTAEHDR